MTEAKVDPKVFEAASEADTHTAAHFYAHQGIPVLPVEGKRPARILGPTGGHKLATTDEQDIDGWWGEDPTLGVALKPGPANLVALDVDGADGKLDAIEAGLDYDNPGTVVTMSPGTHNSGVKGRHFWYTATPEQLKKLEGPKVVGSRGSMELIAYGRYILAPPSTHPEGGNYKVLQAERLAPLPTQLLDQVTGRFSDKTYFGPPEEGKTCNWCLTGLEGCIADITKARTGSRNSTYNACLYRILRFPHPQGKRGWDGWREAASAAYRKVMAGTMSEREIQKKIDSTTASVVKALAPMGGPGSGDCPNREEYMKEDMRIGRSETEARPRPKLLLGTQVKTEATRFLYKEYIPESCYVNLVGESGVGKSAFARFLCQELISGTLQNGTKRPSHGSCLYVTSEESPGRDVVPLIRAGLVDKHGTEDVDEFLSQLVCEDTSDPSCELAIDDNGVSLDAYIVAMKEMPDLLPPKLIVIDSFDYYLRGVDSNPNSMKCIKDALGAVNEVAIRHSLTVLIIDHVSKSKRSNPMDDVAGSTAKNTAARASLRFAYHPDKQAAEDEGSDHFDDQRILVLTKGSFVGAAHTPAEIFEFVPVDITTPNADGEVSVATRAYLRYVGINKSINYRNFESRDE